MLKTSVPHLPALLSPRAPSNNCYSKTRDADASSIVNPTPAQVAGAQVSLKKAQVVLLAANVDYNVTQPVLPNLPKYDTDRLNKYMMSENYSLASTTTL